MPTSPESSPSPSFNTYSNLEKIAARVMEELRAESSSEEIYDEFCIKTIENSSTQKVEGEGDDEFEFALVAKDTEFSSPISADEIFYNGQIRPVFPLFDRDLLLGNAEIESENNITENSGSSKAPRIRVPLGKLFTEERGTTSSSSSWETDELERLPPGTYCVWKPKAAEAEAPRRRKSSSFGSSKRWNFRDLVRRSNSDGRKDGFVFSTPSNKQGNDGTEKAKETPSGATAAVVAPGKRKDDERRRDAVGFFAVVNGLSRNLQPF